MHTPAGGVVLLITTTLLARLLFAGLLGLGVDESYMVAAGRTLHLSYFDHPPIAWWMAWGGAHFFGTDAVLAVRLPFILTFAVSTWLMFRLTSRLFNACAGLWAAALLNAAPLLGVTTGSWVLPDGPLVAALLGAALCLARVVPPPPRVVADLATPSKPLSAAAAWGWWLGAGGCAGLALLSKYTAVLSIGGAILFLLTTPSGRAWLRRPQPYVAGLVALAMFTPVLWWNAEHGWVSLFFQGGRASVSKLHPFGPLSSLGGEALFLLPWIWLPLVLAGAAAIRRGPRDVQSWMLVCMAVPPIALFTVLSLWSHVLFHWAMPGYLMLFPLVGEVVGRLRRTSRTIRIWLAINAVVVTCGALFVASEVRFNWLPEVFENFALGSDPDIDAVDWTSVAADLQTRGLTAAPGVIVATTRWSDTGKIDYALKGRVVVVCLSDDPREYGMTVKLSEMVGRDMVLIVPRTTLAQLEDHYGGMFDSIEPLTPIVLRHAGRPAMLLPVFWGHHLHGRPIALAGTPRAR